MDILISEDLQGPAIERLAQRYQIVRDGGLWKEPQRLLSTIGKARALMVRNQTQVTAELLRAAPELLGVGRLGVGLDNIDVATATSLGVVVVAPFNANATSVAELTLGLILALARKRGPPGTFLESAPPVPQCAATLLEPCLPSGPHKYFPGRSDKSGPGSGW